MKYLLFFLLISNLSFAQINNPAYKKHIPEETIEKLILIPDRNLYLSGEKIWFNAYCFIPEQTAKSNHLSNVLYVELYDNSRELIVKRKFRISRKNNVYGSIDIPSKFLSGNYYLRAYTQFLKNYPPENYFTSLITIINPQITFPEIAKGPPKKKIEITPATGTLIQGINTQVAFKINKALVKNLDKILVVDQENTIISMPSTSINGEGLFEITPHKSSHYTMKLFLENKDSIMQALPEIEKNGIAIKSKIVPENPYSVSIDIINKKSPTENPNQLYNFSVHSQNFKTLIKREIVLVNEITPLAFSANILEDGLNNLVLKDNEGNVVKASAIYHKKNNIEIVVKADKKKYAQRELVNLDIIAPTLNNKRALIVSVSVTKKGLANNSTKLLNYLQKNPQLLKSFLQDPNNTSSLTQDQIDLFMVHYTNLLSKGKYNNVIEQKSNDIIWLPEIRDVSISGIAYNKANKMPITNLPIYVSVFNTNPQVHIYRTQKNGEFIFSLNNLIDNQDIYLCSKPYKEGEVELKIHNDFLQKFPDIREIPLAIDSSNHVLIEEMYINMQAGEIFKTKTGTKQQPTTSIPFNLGKYDVETIMDDYVDSPSLRSIIQESIPNIRVQKKKGQYHLSILNPETLIHYDDPLILVDHIPIFNVEGVLEISPRKINKIDMLKSPLLLGNEIINGIVNVTTNTDNFGGIKPPKGSIFLKYQTISASFEFDSPTYNTKEKKASRLADFRNLLYWNPNLKLKDKASVVFYTSDHCSEYDVIVRGFNDNGKPCYGKTSIKIVPNNN